MIQYIALGVAVFAIWSALLVFAALFFAERNRRLDLAQLQGLRSPGTVTMPELEPEERIEAELEAAAERLVDPTEISLLAESLIEEHTNLSPEEAREEAERILLATMS